MSHKIVTHLVYPKRGYYGSDYFTASIDGVMMEGPNGGKSLYTSRKEAKAEAEYRLTLPHNRCSDHHCCFYI